MFLNVAYRAQTSRYVTFALRCFGRNIGWMNVSPMKSKTLLHPGLGYESGHGKREQATQAVNGPDMNLTLVI